MTIATISRNPPLPAAPEPAPFIVPRMGGVLGVPLAAAKVRRVQEAELEDVLSWLLPRMQEAHPHLPPDGFNAFLRSHLFGPTSLLIRTANVVGLAVARYTLFDPTAPAVEEIFVRSREPANAEACDLYVFMRDWALGLGARCFDFNRDSDAAMTHHVVPALHSAKQNLKVTKSSVFSVALRE